MNAPQNQQHFQPQGQPQQNVGQVRSGQQPNQNAGPPKGSQGTANLNQLYDPQLAQWTLKKGKHASWKDVEPLQNPVTLDNLQREIDRLQKKDVSIQRTLNEITSDNARASVTALVNDENHDLWVHNRQLEWKIAGIELEWQSLNRKYRQLKRIDVLLKTTRRPYTPTGKTMNGPSGNTMGPQDAKGAIKISGMQQDDQFRSQGRNQGPGQNPKMNNNQGPNAGQNQNFNQQHGRGQGGSPQGPGPMQQGPGNPPPPPPPPNMQANGPQNMSGPPPPLPPPNGPKQQQPHQQMHQQQQQPQQQMHQQQQPHQQMHQQHPNLQHQKMGPQFAEAGPYAAMRHEGPRQAPDEVLNAHILQQQKAKPRQMPGEYMSESGSDSDSETDFSGIQSFGAESMEDGVFIRGRSKDKHHSKSRGQSLRRSPSRSAMKKTHKAKSSHRGSKPDLGPPPIGEHSGKSSKHHSPKSSAGNIPPINIHVNAAPINAQEQERERGRNSGRPRDGDDERERIRRRSRDRERVDHDRDHRRFSYDRSVSKSPKQWSSKPSYSKLDNVSTQPMSRTSSSEYGSGTVYSSYSDDDSSIHSVGNNSIFSEPAHTPDTRRASRRHHAEAEARFAAKNIPRQSNEDGLTYPDFDGRKRHPAVNDYPLNTQHRSLRHRTRPVIHHTDAVDASEPWYDERDTSIASWPPTNHPVRGRPNPFDAKRFPPQRSLSYAAHDPEPAHPPYYANQKALPDSQSQRDPYEMQEIIDAGVEALHKQNMSAYEHIAHSRQPLRRSNTVNSRGASRGYDSWANTGYGAASGAAAQRVVMEKIRLADGTVRYVEA